LLDQLYQDEKYPEILTLADQLQETNPAEANYYRGLVLYKTGKWTESIDSFQKALEQGAPEGETRTALAMLYWQQEKRDLCKEELLKVQEINADLIPDSA